MNSHQLRAVRIGDQTAGGERADEDGRHRQLAQRPAERERVGFACPRRSDRGSARAQPGQVRLALRWPPALGRRVGAIRAAARRTVGRPARRRARRRPLRKHHHRRPPVGEAFAPQQVVGLQVAELDELGKLRLAQRADTAGPRERDTTVSVRLALTCDVSGRRMPLKSLALRYARATLALQSEQHSSHCTPGVNSPARQRLSSTCGCAKAACKPCTFARTRGRHRVGLERRRRPQL